MKMLKIVLSILLIFSTPAYASKAGTAVGLGVAAFAAYKMGVANGAANGAKAKKWSSNPATYGLAILAGIMVIQSLKTAKKAKGIEGDLTCAQTNSCFNTPNGNGNGPTGTNNPNLNPNNPGDRALVDLERDRPSIERFLQARERDGYQIDRNSGSVKDPKGKSINSPSSAMDSGGMNAQQRAEAEKDMAEAAKESESLAKSIEEYDEEFGGGGGGGSGTSSSYNSANLNGNRFGGMPNANAGRQPSVAGLSVNHGNDQIGVSGDNIFEMVHRRYETTPGLEQNPTGP